MPIFNFFSFPARTIPRSTSFFPSHISTPVYEPWETIHAAMHTHCTYFCRALDRTIEREADGSDMACSEPRETVDDTYLSNARRQFADFNSRHEDGPMPQLPSRVLVTSTRGRRRLRPAVEGVAAADAAAAAGWGPGT